MPGLRSLRSEGLATRLVVSAYIMTMPQPIHPFPARMAPSIALREVRDLPVGSVVLDPMMGSGTVVRVATEAGHRAIGRDVDPLAVLMARVWITPINTSRLLVRAEELIQEAQSLRSEQVVLPWIEEDVETSQFIDYWFGPDQQEQLRRLSFILSSLRCAEGDALRIALSRTIITKDHGASLARDVSHSRPHRAFATNSYNVYAGFLQATRLLAKRLGQEPPSGQAEVALGDARNVSVDDCSIDAVITSPPYLNAIDYLRGHRLSLVWLGHQVGNLRTIRAESIGTERAPVAGVDTAAATRVIKKMGIKDKLPARQQSLFERYVLDLAGVLAEVRRVLKPGGRAVFVLGNSCVRGVFVSNSAAVSTLAREFGLRLERRSYRDLPPSRRYLPPPTTDGTSNLERRMRKEVVQTYICEP